MSQFPELMELNETGGLTPALVEQHFAMVDMHVGGAVAFALVGFVLVVGIELATVFISKHRKTSEK